MVSITSITCTGMKMEKCTCNYRHTNYSDHTRQGSAAETLSHPAHSQVFPPAMGQLPSQEPASPVPGAQTHSSDPARARSPTLG